MLRWLIGALVLVMACSGSDEYERGFREGAQAGALAMLERQPVREECLEDALDQWADHYGRPRVVAIDLIDEPTLDAIGRACSEYATEQLGPPPWTSP